MENINVRKEVTNIVKRIAPYLDVKSVYPNEFIDGIIDDVMGLFNQEFRGTYTEEAVNQIISNLKSQNEEKINHFKSSNEKLMEEIEQLKSKNKALQNAMTTDTVKKEMEKKIAILQDKNRILKKVVRASLEDL